MPHKTPVKFVESVEFIGFVGLKGQSAVESRELGVKGQKR